MKILFQLVKRNVLLFLRDKASVFFSFLSVIIILLLYILFLGKMQSDNISQAMPNIEGINWLVASWIMAGLLTVSTITVPLGALGNLINDKDKGLINDFYTSPINRKVFALSYLISSWVIAFLMVLLNLIIGQVYVVIQGGELFTFIQTLRMLLLMMLSIMSFSSFFFYISMFMKTQNAFGLLSTMVGTFVGFLGGIYIPIGVLGQNIQNVMNVLPTSHAVTLIRKAYMEGAIDKVFGLAPQAEYDSYASVYGLVVKIGDYELSNLMMVLSLVTFGLIFYSLSALKLQKSKL